MSVPQQLSPEVLLILVNTYKDISYLSDRAVKYGEAIIDSYAKQVKALESKVAELERALNDAKQAHQPGDNISS